MRTFLKIGLLINIVLLMVSCTNDSNNSIDKRADIDSVYAIVRTIDTDSFYNVSIEWRTNISIVIGIFKDSTSNKWYPPLLLKRDINNELIFLSGERWVGIDSLHHYFPLRSMRLSIKRTKYYFYIMDKLNVSKIKTTYKNEALWISKDNFVFYYVYDSTSIFNRKGYNKLLHISDNWWIRPPAD